MSGAVSRRISFCTDMALTWLWLKYWHADHHRMEDEAQSEIHDRTYNDCDQIVDASTHRNWWRAGIAAVLQGDAVIDGPGQHRAEQNHAAEVAVCAQMREGPGFHSGQHRMLEHTLDIARDVSGDDHDTRRPHQKFNDMARPCRRAPYSDEARGAIACEAIGNENNAGDGDHREEAAIRPFTDPRNECGATIAHRYEHMRAEENNKAEDFDGETHQSTQELSGFGCAARGQLMPVRGLVSVKPLFGNAALTLRRHIVCCASDKPQCRSAPRAP